MLLKKGFKNESKEDLSNRMENRFSWEEKEKSVGGEN